MYANIYYECDGFLSNHIIFIFKIRATVDKYTLIFKINVYRSIVQTTRTLSDKNLKGQKLKIISKTMKSWSHYVISGE